MAASGPRSRSSLQDGPQDRRAGPHLPFVRRGLKAPESRHRRLPAMFLLGDWELLSRPLGGGRVCRPERNCRQAGAQGCRLGVLCSEEGRPAGSGPLLRLSDSPFGGQTPAGASAAGSRASGGTGFPLLPRDLRQPRRRAKGRTWGRDHRLALGDGSAIGRTRGHAWKHAVTPVSRWQLQ